MGNYKRDVITFMIKKTTLDNLENDIEKFVDTQKHVYVVICSLNTFAYIVYNKSELITLNKDHFPYIKNYKFLIDQNMEYSSYGKNLSFQKDGFEIVKLILEN